MAFQRHDHRAGGMRHGAMGGGVMGHRGVDHGAMHGAMHGRMRDDMPGRRGTRGAGGMHELPLR
jgi:hypothetical protein